MASSERMGARSTPSLETEELGFAYGGREVLSGVSIRVDPGELVGVVGPNGSGKTTLLRILSAVLAGYEGSARIGGQELRTIPRRELARELAVVPQEPTFAFPFTVLEVVLLGRHPHLAGLGFEAPNDLALARESLERCGAADLAERGIHELSAGERQRVVFARALAQQPRTLLLDEPASFLDVRHQIEIFDIVRSRVDDAGRSALTVLHDLNLASQYCDRLYLVRAGRVVAAGPTEEVLTYANLKRVFETEIYVDRNSLTGKLIVVPMPGTVRPQPKGEAR